MSEHHPAIPILQRWEESIEFLRNSQCDGWLAYDFRRSNSLACQALGIPNDRLITRRFLYWLPANGQPVKIVHGIEPGVLDDLPGDEVVYTTWQELEAALEKVLKGVKCVAMEYSPRNSNPYLSKVDAGTIELVRSFNIEVISSGNLIQRLTSVLSSEQIRAHQIAAHSAGDIMKAAWSWIKSALENDYLITEFSVQSYLLDQIEKRGFITDVSPLCAVNANSADPHYLATESEASIIQKNDFIMIDLGCKIPGENGVYADITHVAVAAKEPTSLQKEVFEVVKHARDTACTLIEERFASGVPLMGCDIDRATRTTIEEAGYGQYFIHRTGHNIGFHEHGDGAHLDSYETIDTRTILPATCFSIEPGIYIPGDFGVRLEHDVLILQDGEVQMTGDMQQSLHCLFANNH